MREIKRRLGSHEDYNPVTLAKRFSEDAVRREYTRMREALRKNVSRIRKSGEFADAQIIKTYEDSLPASQMSHYEVVNALSHLEQAMSANVASLAGLREQRRMTIETLRDRGYEGINASNYKEFIRYMEATRSIALSVMRYKYNRRGIAVGDDRNRRLELFDMAQRKGISTNALINDFRFYNKHADEIDQLPDRSSGRKLGTKKVRRLIKEMK